MTDGIWQPKHINVEDRRNAGVHLASVWLHT